VAPQGGDQIAADLLAEKRAEFGAGDRLEQRNGKKDQAFQLREGADLGPLPGRGPDRCGKSLLGPKA
jgi:hypothetical protein